MTCDDYLDQQEGSSVTCDDSHTLASCICNTNYYLDGDTCIHKDSCTRQSCIWSEWADWSSCSVTCGTGVGVQSRVRTGNDACTEESIQTQNCNGSGDACCGTCQPWAEWGTCNVTCGTGTQSRSRSCGPDAGCPDANQTRSCDVGFTCAEACSICGTWGQWSSCSVGCGSQSKSRTRTCSPGTCEEQTEEQSCDSNAPIAKVNRAITPCGEYLDKETVLVRRTLGGKFTAASSDDLAGTAVDGIANGRIGSAFSMVFPQGATHYLFTSGDCSKWVKISKSEIDAALSFNGLKKVTVHSTNLNSNSHSIWMNFAINAGGPIILNTNSNMYGCPVVYAENDAIFEGCLDKITLSSGKKIHISPKPYELLQ